MMQQQQQQKQRHQHQHQQATKSKTAKYIRAYTVQTYLISAEVNTIYWNIKGIVLNMKLLPVQ